MPLGGTSCAASQAGMQGLAAQAPRVGVAREGSSTSLREPGLFCLPGTPATASSLVAVLGPALPPPRRQDGDSEPGIETVCRRAASKHPASRRANVQNRSRYSHLLSGGRHQRLGRRPSAGKGRPPAHSPSLSRLAPSPHQQRSPAADGVGPACREQRLTLQVPARTGGRGGVHDEGCHLVGGDGTEWLL